ncbi:uncharacterized protein LOC133178760 [Saccostrea echinata]|uniref:uncharacterized protein LOC133178760 n=1 Tax=Saccostrea echinata TaxID=191078 RepID=UPI002A7F8262|nr:uncharacterized protein LOC133178760 [Saccostrea echinata]
MTHEQVRIFLLCACLMCAACLGLYREEFYFKTTKEVTGERLYMNKIIQKERRSVIECVILCEETEDCLSVFGCKFEGETTCTLFNQSYVYGTETNSSTCKHYTKHRDMDIEETSSNIDNTSVTFATDLTTTNTSCENQVSPFMMNKGNASFGTDMLSILEYLCYVFDTVLPKQK